MPLGTTTLAGKVNPLAVVSERDFVAALNDRQNKCLEELTAEADEIQQKFLAASAAKNPDGTDVNLGQIQAFGTGTASEIAGRMMEANAVLAACNELIANKQSALEMLAAAETIAQDGGSRRPLLDLEALQRFSDQSQAGTRLRAPYDLGEAFVKAASEQGWQFGGRGKQNNVVSTLPMPGLRYPQLTLPGQLPGTDPTRLVPQMATFSSGGGAPAWHEIGIHGRDTSEGLIVEVWPTIRKFPVMQESISYLKETTRISEANVAAEGAAAAEGTLVYVEKKLMTTRISVFLPVTEDALRDVYQVYELINFSLLNAVLEKCEQQFLWGTGSSNQWMGITDDTAVLSHDLDRDDATGKEPKDALMDLVRAATKVRVDGQAIATDVAMHPNLWLGCMLATNANGGQLYLGNPADGFKPAAWGLRVLQTTNGITWDDGNVVGVVYARPYVSVGVHQGLQVEMGDNSDDFRKYKHSFRAAIWGNVKSPRPKAVCKLSWPGD